MHVNRTKHLGRKNKEMNFFLSLELGVCLPGGHPRDPNRAGENGAEKNTSETPRFIFFVPFSLRNWHA